MRRELKRLEKQLAAAKESVEYLTHKRDFELLEGESEEDEEGEEIATYFVLLEVEVAKGKSKYTKMPLQLLNLLIKTNQLEIDNIEHKIKTLQNEN